MSIFTFPSGWSLPAIIGGASLLLYSVGLFIYRLFFHPLARFPGPKLAAASKWYEFYFDVLKGDGGQFAWEIERMHQVYGPIVRINHDELHVADPDWYDTLYARNPTHRDKWPPAAKMAGTGLDSFGAVDHDLHRKRRAVNSPVFSKRAIMAAEPLIHERVKQLCEGLHKSHVDGDIVELRIHLLALATDAVSRYIIGESMELQKEIPRAKEWSDTIIAITGFTPMAKQFPWMIGLSEKFPVSALEKLSPEVGRMARFRQVMLEKASSFVADQISSPKAELDSEIIRPSSIFQAIHHSSLPPAEKSVRRMASEAFAAVIAGGETASRTMTMAVYYLLTNVKALERLDEELLTVMPDVRVMPSLKSLETLPWLTAVIKETLRLSAVIPSRLPLRAPDELKFRDWIIPPKTPVSMSIHEVLHDPRVFPSPLEFKPERWLDQASVSTSSERLDRYFVPFGRGTRMCQGMNFAYAELYLTLATILRRFKFQLHDTEFERDVKIVRDYFVGEVHPQSKGVRVKIVSEEAV